MQAIADHLEPVTEELLRGVVKAANADAWLVQTDADLVSARQGFSCAFTPAMGDLVLLSVGAGGCYILAILERQSGLPAELTAAGGLRISSPNLDLVSENMNLSGETISFWGQLIQTQAKHIKNTAASVENMISRLKERLIHAHRKVEGMDLVQAAHLTREATDLYSARSGYTVMSCDEDMKIDAKHIHLG